jgi:hypothetical protein
VIGKEWININKMVIARKDGRGGGNLPLYTAITRILDDSTDPLWLSWASWAHQMKFGLYARDPRNTQKQETWDNYLGWIAMSAQINMHTIPKDMIKYGLIHCGFFSTTGKLTKESWLWRHIHLWALAVPAAYPILKLFYRPYLRLIARYLNANHPGGVILDWLWFYTADKLGMKHEKFKTLTKKLPEALMDQLDHDHPAIALARKLC